MSEKFHFSNPVGICMVLCQTIILYLVMATIQRDPTTYLSWRLTKI